ncbi:MAG: hypothetical protein ACYSU0_08340, partial [Planctomycetota bacterium]
AAWTWMRYSYTWEVTLSTLFEPSEKIRMQQRYVRASGRIVAWFSISDSSMVNGRGVYLALLGPATGAESSVHVASPPWSRPCPVGIGVVLNRSADGLLSEQGTVQELEQGTLLRVTGRALDLDMLEPPSGLVVDATASRFTGASVAGLVVGAMGVFVFTVALRHWLGERRKLREAVE